MGQIISDVLTPYAILFIMFSIVPSIIFIGICAANLYYIVKELLLWFFEWLRER